MKNINRILIAFIHIIIILSISGCVNYNRSVDADCQKMERDPSSIEDMDITIKETFYPEKNMTIKKFYRGPDIIMQETDIDGVKKNLIPLIENVFS